RPGGAPLPQVSEREAEPGPLPRRRPRGADHLSRVVHPDHVRPGPPVGKGRGQVPRAAAEVDDETRVAGPHPGEQVEERAAPAAGEPLVFAWIPHRGPTLSTSRYHRTAASSANARHREICCAP